MISNWLPKRHLRLEMPPSFCVNRETECRINTSTLLLICWNLGDALVMNDTHVLPARLYVAKKEETGGHVELLLLKNTSGDEWKFWLNLPNASRLALVSTRRWCLALSLQKNCYWRPHLYFEYQGIFLSLGKSRWYATATYIHEKLDDRERYQAVYAKESDTARLNCWTALRKGYPSRNPS